jgi:hypothetical protein
MTLPYVRVNDTALSATAVEDLHRFVTDSAAKGTVCRENKCAYSCIKSVLGYILNCKGNELKLYKSHYTHY